MDGYDVGKMIGRGAYSSVFIARRKSDALNVVDKQINVEGMTAAEKEATLREVGVLKMLRHPFIVYYYDSFVADEGIHIMMEYADGTFLLLAFFPPRRGPSPPRAAGPVHRRFRADGPRRRTGRPPGLRLARNEAAGDRGWAGKGALSVALFSAAVTRAARVPGPCGATLTLRGPSARPHAQAGRFASAL